MFFNVMHQKGLVGRWTKNVLFQLSLSWRLFILDEGQDKTFQGQVETVGAAWDECWRDLYE